jgi:thymidylate synthase ThyX
MYMSEVEGRDGIYAKVVLASISKEQGIPIYTLEVRAPKFIDAEFEKHRMLSSNSSSSRAIPFRELDHVYTPSDLRAKEKGMQGFGQVNDSDKSAFIRDMRDLYFDMLVSLIPFEDIVHKQHLNRYIEPWMMQTKVVTATEWDNFFNLRLDKAAQPEIQELAKCMQEALSLVKGKEQELSVGDWHLPYAQVDPDGDTQLEIVSSVARCARVSYKNHDKTTPTLDQDGKLYTTLYESKHCTPFEHQATPMPNYGNDTFLYPGITHQDYKGRYWSGNFQSWIQYRQTVFPWN